MCLDYNLVVVVGWLPFFAIEARLTTGHENGIFLSSAARGRKGGGASVNWGLGSLEEFERTFRFCGDRLCIATTVE